MIVQLFIIFTICINVLLFPRSAYSLLNVPIRFPCQQFLGGYSGALVWKLRKCVINEDVEHVGGERRSVRGGMPKGRSEWAAEMYKRRAQWCSDTTAHSDLFTFFLCFLRKKKTNWRRSSTGSLKTSYQAEPWGIFFNVSHWLNPTVTTFLSFFASFVPEHSGQPIRYIWIFPSFILCCVSSRASLYAARHPYIWASFLHGDQHGHCSCPSAAFSDGGVPSVSGHSLRLQGWTARAPPPLCWVRHHWGGRWRLLHPGGGPGPALLPADTGKPEKEYQMNYSRGNCSLMSLTYLARLQLFGNQQMSESSFYEWWCTQTSIVGLEMTVWGNRWDRWVLTLEFLKEQLKRH